MSKKRTWKIKRIERRNNKRQDSHYKNNSIAFFSRQATPFVFSLLGLYFSSPFCLCLSLSYRPPSLHSPFPAPVFSWSFSLFTPSLHSFTLPCLCLLLPSFPPFILTVVSLFQTERDNDTYFSSQFLYPAFSTSSLSLFAFLTFPDASLFQTYP